MSDQTNNGNGQGGGNNPFATALVERNEHAPATVAGTTAREVSEVQAAMAIAKRFPRDQIEAMDRILSACRRPTLADAAIYAYPRGDQMVTGPSIRLAEALAQNWGNVQIGIRELSQSTGESTVEAFAWDVETNTRAVKVFQVPHIRHTRKGQYKLTDPRDIYELVANQGARRLRACILSVIPGDVVEAAIKECEVTQKNAMGAPEDVLKRMLKAFADDYGVTRAQIEKRLQHRLDSIVMAEILSLKRIYVAIRDGMSSVGDYFPPEGGDEAVGESAKEKVTRKAAAAKAPTSASKQATPPQGAEQEPVTDEPEDQEPEEDPEVAAHDEAEDEGGLF